MTMQKTSLLLNNLLFKGLLLILITFTTTACLTNEVVSKKEDIVQIMLDGENDDNLIDFETTSIGSTNVIKKTFKLTNRSKQNVLVNFTIPKGYNRVASDATQGKECDDATTMLVEGNAVCYFGIEFKPTMRLTHKDNAPLSIEVDMDGTKYNYNKLFILQGIAKNSESITVPERIDFGSTARNSSKISSAILHNSTKQSIFYNMVIPDNITIDKKSTCKPSGFIKEESSCEVQFRYSATTTTGDIEESISVEQDEGNKTITASMSVKNSAIVNIVGPASRYDASMIVSNDTVRAGELKLIGGKNEAGNSSTTDIWTYNILKKTWTFVKKSPFPYTDTLPAPASNIDALYGNRVVKIGSKTLILPGQITLTPAAPLYSSLAATEDTFDNKTFQLGSNNTIDRIDSATDNARNNYKIATNPDTQKVYIYGGIHKKVTVDDIPGDVDPITTTYTLTDNVSLVRDNGSFENIVTIDNPDRHLAAFAAVDDTFYLLGGSTKDNNTATTISKTFFKYDNKTKKWADISDASTGVAFLSPNNSAEMVYIENGEKSLYVFGGKFGSDISEEDKAALYKFDITTSTWSRLINQIMPPSRTKHNLVPFSNTHIYLFGGETSDGKPINDLWVFDIALKKWEKINFPLLDQKLDHQAVTASKDGRYIYIYGGQTADGIASTKFMVYDTELNYFKELAEIGTPTGTEFNRFGHQLVSAKNGSVILLIGGSTTLGGEPSDKNYQYNINENTWTELTPTESTTDLKVADHTAVNKDGVIYVIGGRSSNLTTGTASDKVITLTFADNETTTKPVVVNTLKDLTTARFKHSATVVGEDIYVAGGYTTATNKTNSVVKFNTTTPAWSDVNLATAVDGTGFTNSSLVAEDTTLYLIGGMDSSDNEIAKIYQSVDDGTWAEVLAGTGSTLNGEVKFSGQTYFIKANGAFINFGGDVLSIIYP